MRGINSHSNKSNTFLRYAKVYDVLNADKDYKKESIYIDSLINKFIEKPKNEIRILDLACGTGKHALEFYDSSDSLNQDLEDVFTPFSFWGLFQSDEGVKLDYWSDGFNSRAMFDYKIEFHTTEYVDTSFRIFPGSDNRFESLSCGLMIPRKLN